MELRTRGGACPTGAEGTEMKLQGNFVEQMGRGGGYSLEAGKREWTDARESGGHACMGDKNGWGVCIHEGMHARGAIMDGRHACTQM